MIAARILIIIVNYRTADLTIDALGSLAPEIARVPSAQCIVVDNASGDLSSERIAKAIAAHGWSDWCHFRALPHNGGFAYGNNEAIRLYQREAAAPIPDYVWLLNPDTIVLPGALAELVDFMDAHPEAGIAGGRSEDRDGAVWNSAFRFHTIWSEIDTALSLGIVSRLLRRYRIAPPISETVVRCDWVAGASMMIRRAVFDAIGLLDQGYFMYFEETDFCLRAHRAGFQTWYVPQSRIIHLIGQASGIASAKAERKRRPRYWFDSRSRYFRKNHGQAGWITANIAWAIAYPLGRFKGWLKREASLDPPKLWQDFIAANFGTTRPTEKY